MSHSSHYNRPPTALGLVDFDPDGICILLQYKYGSRSLAHEAATSQAPTLRWLGCSSDDIAGRPGSKQNQSLIQLSARDHQKTTAMLLWPFMSEDSWDPWRRELQVMLMLQWKFEMEMLESIQEQISKCL